MSLANIQTRGHIDLTSSFVWGPETCYYSSQI